MDQGKQRLAILENGGLTPLETPFEASNVPVPFGDRLAMTGASATDPGGLVVLDPASGAVEWIKRAADVTIDPDDVALAEPFQFQTENGLAAHAFFYRADQQVLHRAGRRESRHSSS